MERVWQEYKLPIALAAAAIIALLSSVVQVPEAEQAVIIRTGDPVRVVNRFRPDTPYGETGAGLVLRIPFFERV